MRKNLHLDLFLMALPYCYSTVLSGKIWQEMELELEPEPKINNFSSATLHLSLYSSTFQFYVLKMWYRYLPV